MAPFAYFFWLHCTFLLGPAIIGSAFVPQRFKLCS